MEKIKVGFVDDQRLFRIGFSRVIRCFKNIDLLFEAESGKELLEQIQEKGLPDVVLVDLDMPEMDGIQVAKVLKEKFPTVKPIILTGHDDDELIVRLLQDGFCAYLHKDAHEKEVERAIYAVVENGSFTSGKAQEALGRNEGAAAGQKHSSSANETLTDSELEIIKLICKGFKDIEIANALNKGLRTIQNQRLALRKKLKAKTAADLISYAVKHKLVEGTDFYNYK